MLSIFKQDTAKLVAVYVFTATLAFDFTAVAATMTATVDEDAAPGRFIPTDFAGISIEYTELPNWLGTNSTTGLNPIFQQLLKNLNGGVLRVGGNSQDRGYWMNSVSPCTYRITQTNLNVVARTMDGTGWRALMGANLARSDAANPSGDGAANCVDFVRNGILSAFTDRTRLLAVGFGNEPNAYVSHGYRSSPYPASSHLIQYNRYANALMADPLANLVAFSGPGYSGRSPWSVGTFLDGAPAVDIATDHYYAASTCSEPPPAGYEPTITNILSQEKMASFYTIISEMVSTAASKGRPHRLEETNTASCRGMSGVSNVMASTLWGLDFLFTAAYAGTTGVNFHIADGTPDGPYAEYNAINSRRQDDGTGFVTEARPLYYAMLMFAREAEGGSFLPMTGTTNANCKSYAVRGADNSKRVFFINKQTSTDPITVTLTPSRRVPGRTATLLRLKNTNLTTGISDLTYGGRLCADNGTLPTPIEETIVANAAGDYVITVGYTHAVRLRIP